MSDYLSLSDFAAQLGVSEEVVQQLREQGRIRAFRDGSSWKFKVSELETARNLLVEQGDAAGGSDNQDFELTAGNEDEGSSGSMDSLLIDDPGDGGASQIISDIEEGSDDSSLGLADSDINLADGISSSSIDPASETGVSSLSLGEGSDILEGSSINKPINAAAEDDDEQLGLSDDDYGLQLDDDQGSDASIDLGGEERDSEGTGSEVSLGLGEDSLDLGASGIGVAESGELSLDLEGDDEDSSLDLMASQSGVELDSDSDKGSSPSAGSSGGSGIALVDDDEDIDLADDGTVAGASGVSLAEESGVLLAGESGVGVSGIATGDSGLELIEPAGASGAPIPGDSGVGLGGDDDFLLTPVDGELDDDDSGSQVIALDSDSISSDSALFGSGSGLEAGEFSGIGLGDGLEADDGLEAGETGTMTGSMAAAAGVSMVPAEPPYSFMNVLSLGLTAMVLVVAGFMALDLVNNMWSYNEPYAVNSTIMDGILGLLPGS